MEKSVRNTNNKNIQTEVPTSSKKSMEAQVDDDLVNFLKFFSVYKKF